MAPITSARGQARRMPRRFLGRPVHRSAALTRANTVPTDVSLDHLGFRIDGALTP